MRRREDAPWHAAKAQIAEALDDLTLLWRVTPERRAAALASGVSRWTDETCCATTLGITGSVNPAILDAVIRANRSAADGAIVFPARVTVEEPNWRDAAPAEFFVDFETVSDLDEDFSTFPDAGGEALIFMIGCGHFTGPREAPVWNFRVFTTNALVPAEERRIIEAWLDHMQAIAAANGQALEASRAFHWSPAETSTLTEAYNAAHRRHGQPPWPRVPWIDLLNRVIKAQPVTVRGAFGFGLKAMARALHANGLVETLWSDSATDGLGAMVGAWACHHEAAQRGVAMPDVDLMKEIEAYNEVDCKVMAEVLTYLRRHR
jgi:predicted RecB family nuclease